MLYRQRKPRDVFLGICGFRLQAEGCVKRTNFLDSRRLPPEGGSHAERSPGPGPSHETHSERSATSGSTREQVVASTDIIKGFEDYGPLVPRPLGPAYDEVTNAR